MTDQRQAYTKQLEKEWLKMTQAEKVDFVLDKIMQETPVMNMKDTVTRVMSFLNKNDTGKLQEFRDKLSEADLQ